MQPAMSTPRVTTRQPSPELDSLEHPRLEPLGEVVGLLVPDDSFIRFCVPRGGIQLVDLHARWVWWFI